MTEVDLWHHSQSSQDQWVLEQTGHKQGGFFVEFGATGGKIISNTYVLEKDYNWSGIVAEPNPVYHSELTENRNCSISKKCVYNKNGKVKFLATKSPDISTISGYGTDDEFADIRQKTSEVIEVDGITLVDLLVENNAPQVIDYVSIDTEGSEYDILKSYFDDPRSANYRINLLTIEHNFGANRNRIYDLMIDHGYERVFDKRCSHDDFYKLRG